MLLFMNDNEYEKYSRVNHYFFPETDIKKVIQNGPATVIIDNQGQKTVVKARYEKISKTKGFYACLLKRSVSSKVYHDILSLYPDNPAKERMAMEGALILIYGKDTLISLRNKWVKRTN